MDMDKSPSFLPKFTFASEKPISKYWGAKEVYFRFLTVIIISTIMNNNNRYVDGHNAPNV